MSGYFQRAHALCASLKRARDAPPVARRARFARSSRNTWNWRQLRRPRRRPPLHIRPLPRPPSQPQRNRRCNDRARRRCDAKSPRAPIAVQQCPVRSAQQVERVAVDRGRRGPSLRPRRKGMRRAGPHSAPNSRLSAHRASSEPKSWRRRGSPSEPSSFPPSPNRSRRRARSEPHFTPVVHEDRIEHAVDRAPIAPRAERRRRRARSQAQVRHSTTVRIGSISLQVHVPPPPAVAPAPAPRPTSIAQPTPAPQTQPQRRFSPQRHYLRWS